MKKKITILAIFAIIIGLLIVWFLIRPTVPYSDRFSGWITIPTTSRNDEIYYDDDHSPNGDGFEYYVIKYTNPADREKLNNSFEWIDGPDVETKYLVDNNISNINTGRYPIDFSDPYRYYVWESKGGGSWLYMVLNDNTNILYIFLFQL